MSLSAQNGIYRVMDEEKGFPKVGDGFCELGVRELDRATGVSVAPDWRSLFPIVVPERFRVFPELRGARNTRKPTARIWRLEELPYLAGPVGNHLQLVTSKPDHGGLLPMEQLCDLQTFHGYVASTRERWHIDEPSVATVSPSSGDSNE